MSRQRRQARAERRKQRLQSPLAQMPFRQLSHPRPPYEWLAEDQLEQLHLASMQILEEFMILKKCFVFVKFRKLYLKGRDKFWIRTVTPRHVGEQMGFRDRAFNRETKRLLLIRNTYVYLVL